MTSDSSCSVLDLSPHSSANDSPKTRAAWSIPLAILAVVSMIGAGLSDVAPVVKGGPAVPGDIAWMLTATALVLLMTPGLSFFYGGMVSRKNIVSTMLQSFVSMGVVSLLWVVVGFSLAFGDSMGGFIGDPRTFFFFRGVGGATHPDLSPTIPLTLFALFQLKFAIITPALITGAFAERMRFSSYLLFISLFSLLVYAPLAHWTWHPQGFLRQMGVLDFAGGTVVHMAAGFAALAGALALGRRKSHMAQVAHVPANVPFVLLGTGMLWFGWFGFNAGSALEANGSAALAMINTFVATAAGGLFWMLTERAMGHKGSALGFCSGVIAGLVAVTPAAGNSGPFGAILLGAIASVICYFFVAKVKPALGYDDALDAFGIHGVGGIVGAIGTGIVYSPALGGPGAADYDMGGQLVTQAFAVVVTIAVAAIGTTIAMYIAKAVTGLRVDEESEVNGLDISEHGERAYN